VTQGRATRRIEPIAVRRREVLGDSPPELPDPSARLYDVRLSSSDRRYAGPRRGAPKSGAYVELG